MTGKIQGVWHGGLTIRAGLLEGVATARAFAGERLVAEARGATQGAAIQRVQDLIDQRQQARHAARRAGIPTAEEFTEAFHALECTIGAHHWLMLKAHYAAPARTLSAQDLAAAAGYDSDSSADEKYGLLARKLARFLDFTPPSAEVSGAQTVWTFTLARAGPRNSANHLTWQMHPEVARALEMLNIVAR